MLSLNSLGSEGLFQPFSLQAKPSFTSYQSFAASQKFERLRIENVAGLDLEINLENVCVENVKHPLKQMGNCELFRYLCLLG